MLVPNKKIKINPFLFICLLLCLFVLDEIDLEEESSTCKWNDKLDLQKWTSDSELYKAEQEVETRMEDNWKTLELKSQGGSKWQPETDSEKHPLRRSRAQIQLSNEASSSGGASVAESATFSCSLPPRVPNYSEHEMEDWILDGEHEPSPSKSEEAGATALLLPAISENSYESDDEDKEEEQLFVPAIYTPECDQVLRTNFPVDLVSLNNNTIGRR